MPAASLRLAFASLAVALCAVPALAEEAPKGCLYVEIASLPVKYAGPALEPTITGSVNGKPARMLIDTGSMLTALVMDSAEKLGLALSPTGQWASGIGGDTRLYQARVNELGVGPPRGTATKVPVIGTTGSKPGFDVIIGAKFLLQADLEIALADREIKFFRPHDCKDTFLGYWKDAQVTVIPYSWRYTHGDNPHFTVELNGTPLDAMINSGASSTLIELDAARKAGLKLDAPDVRHLTDLAGVGASRVEHWSARFDKLSIGDEIITDAHIGVMESQGNRTADIYLGRDFLRTHRVLFAKSQKKLYLTYLGGSDVFVSHATTIEPWIQREADEGNPDAEFLLSNWYRTGTNVPRNPAAATRWIEQAARHGHPIAERTLGRRLMLSGRDAEAVPRLRAALDQLPNDYQGALWLYIARLRSQQAALGQQELDTAFKTSKDWPAPVAQFYLGRIDAAGMFAQATGKTPEITTRRVCDGTAAVADLYTAQGKPDDAKAIMAAHADCKLAPRPALVAAAAP